MSELNNTTETAVDAARNLVDRHRLEVPKLEDVTANAIRILHGDTDDEERFTEAEHIVQSAADAYYALGRAYRQFYAAMKASNGYVRDAYEAHLMNATNTEGKAHVLSVLAEAIAKVAPTREYEVCVIGYMTVSKDLTIEARNDEDAREQVESMIANGEIDWSFNVDGHDDDITDETIKSIREV